MRIGYGRSLVNTQVRKPSIAIRSKNISVACCISQDSVVYWKASECAYNRASFGEYMGELFQVLRERNVGPSVFILDNVPFHHSETVVNTFRAWYHEVMFLPPYSPELNPIEELFSKLKGIVKRAESRNVEQLLESIGRAHEMVTRDDCQGYYNHMRSYVDRALNREDY